MNKIAFCLIGEGKRRETSGLTEKVKMVKRVSNVASQRKVVPVEETSTKKQGWAHTWHIRVE